MQSGRCKQNSPLTVLLVILLGLTTLLKAEQLPITTYTVSEGLAHDHVRKIVRDSRGFLWFCTQDGLSWFEGDRFTTYGVNHGLPLSSVNDLLETRDGTYWIATNGGGVARFNPAGPELFSPVRLGEGVAANLVNVLYEDRNANLWAGTNGGLFRLSAAERATGSFRRVELKIPLRSDQLLEVVAFTEDREGSLWMGTAWGLLRRLPSGKVIHYALQPSAASDLVQALLIDQQDRLWVAHQSGLVLFRPDAAPDIRMRW